MYEGITVTVAKQYSRPLYLAPRCTAMSRRKTCFDCSQHCTAPMQPSSQSSTKVDRNDKHKSCRASKVRRSTSSPLFVLRSSPLCGSGHVPNELKRRPEIASTVPTADQNTVAAMPQDSGRRAKPQALFLKIDHRSYRFCVAGYLLFAQTMARLERGGPSQGSSNTDCDESGRSRQDRRDAWPSSRHGTPRHDASNELQSMKKRSLITKSLKRLASSRARMTSSQRAQYTDDRHGMERHGMAAQNEFCVLVSRIVPVDVRQHDCG